MKWIILVLALGLVSGASGVTATAAKENAPDWGSQYTIYGGGYISFTFSNQRGDNISINATPVGGQVGIYIEAFYLNSSNDSLVDGAYWHYVDTLDFWITIANDYPVTLELIASTYATVYATINRTSVPKNTTRLDALEVRLNTLYSWDTTLEGEIANLSTLERYIENETGLMNSTQRDQAAQLEQMLSDIQSQSENFTEQIQNLNLTNTTTVYNITSFVPYNDTAVWDEIHSIEATPLVNNTIVNQTLVNQTVVNQTLVNKTEVQPMTFINKTIESQSKIDYLTSAIVGIIGGIIGGFIIAGVLIRRKKPEIIYMKNVEPPEKLKEQMMGVRKLQSQDAEAEVKAEDNEKGK